MLKLKMLTEQLLGYSICGCCLMKSGCLFLRALNAGLQKRNQIISREGDADGERRKNEYLVQLIAEEIESSRMEAYCDKKYREKEKALCRPAETPNRNKSIISVAHFSNQSKGDEIYV